MRPIRIEFTEQQLGTVTESRWIPLDRNIPSFAVTASGHPGGTMTWNIEYTLDPDPERAESEGTIFTAFVADEAGDQTWNLDNMPVSWMRFIFTDHTDGNFLGWVVQGHPDG